MQLRCLRRIGNIICHEDVQEDVPWRLTLRERLDHLFDSDTRARWRIILSSAVVVAFCGIIAQSSGTSLPVAQLAATIIGAAVFLCQMIIYTLPAKTSSLRRARQRTELPALPGLTKRSLFRPALTLAATALVAIIGAASAPVVGATVLNRRLENLLDKREAEPIARAAEASHIVTYAIQSQLKLRDDLIVNATQKFRKANTEADWLAFQALLNYTVNWRVSKWNVKLMATNVRLLNSIETAPPCGPTSNGIGLAEVFIDENGIERVEDRRPWPNMFNDCRLSLDERTLKDAFLTRVILEYRGGPLTLENVLLSTVRFEMANSENAHKLADAIFHAESNIVTFSVR